MKIITVTKFYSFIFSILILVLFTSNQYSQSWQTLGSGAGGDVNALINYGGQLIVAGKFSIAGGQPVNHIAKWDGSTWQSLGLGTNDDVNALTIYDGNLVAGGKFTTAGGISCNKVAIWDGSSWSSTNGIFNGDVFSLADMGTFLAAGGNFTSINGTSVNYVAKWTNTWESLGAGLNGDVNALSVFNSTLYAGGNFTVSNGQPVKRIARLVGSNWINVGVGLDDGIVFCLHVFNNSLYAGGTFTSIGGSPTNRIARWNGSSWANVGFGFSSGVYALHSLGTTIYAGGDFDFADFLPASKIASNNGSGWVSLGSGIGGSSPRVKALNSFMNDIIVGGHFATAGGQSANNIANWRLTTGITPLSNIIPKNYSLEQNYPNPFNPSTKIKFSIPAEGKANISLYDSKGTLVNTLLNGNLLSGVYEVTFDASILPSGVYFYKLIINNFSSTKKMILLK